MESNKNNIQRNNAGFGAVDIFNTATTKDNVTSKDGGEMFQSEVLSYDVIGERSSDSSHGHFNSSEGSCGMEFRDKIKCTRYNSNFGPVYWGNIGLANFNSWDLAISMRAVTQFEKDIIVGMSPNEGNLDAVQSYDSEVVTVGAMQKTLKTNGKGEFYTQIKEFKKEMNDSYKRLFVNCGWEIKNNKLYYRGKTGRALKELIRKGFTSKNFGKNVKCIPLEPLIRACKDTSFQTKQVMDFIRRLRKVLELKPTGYQYRIKEYLISKLGRATALDHHINRPSYVSVDFSKALDRFFIANPSVSKNPSNWGGNHSNYEESILDDCGKTRRGTDMENRYNKLKNQF